MELREVTTHRVNGMNEKLRIEVGDEPGAGGANHVYAIHYQLQSGIEATQTLAFQNGPILESGVNGISHEALIAIVLDRLKGFQQGQYACRENALAITKLEEAAMWLNHRTQQRIARGVEGTAAK